MLVTGFFPFSHNVFQSFFYIRVVTSRDCVFKSLALIEDFYPILKIYIFFFFQIGTSADDKFEIGTNVLKLSNSVESSVGEGKDAENHQRNIYAFLLHVFPFTCTNCSVRGRAKGRKHREKRGNACYQHFLLFLQCIQLAFS